MKILATGTAGMLGSGLIPALTAAGHDVVATDINLSDPAPFGASGPRLHLLDVRSRDDVFAAVASTRPDLVVHLAAVTNLEDSERDPDTAFATNAVGTKHVALACRNAGVPIAYISTAGVFDGEKAGPYDEFDEPNPLNIYGLSKLEGEHYVRWFCDRAYVLRAGWMVGGGRKDHKFVGRILQQVRDGSDTIYAVTDKFGTPTYVPDFATCFIRLISKASYGLYHMACRGGGTRYDVASHILEILGLRDRITLVPVDSDFFGEEFFATRPRSEIMRNRVLELQDDNTMRPWRVALTDYIAAHVADDPTLLALARESLVNAPMIPAQWAGTANDVLTIPDPEEMTAR